MPAAFVPLNLAAGAARLSRFPSHLLWIAIGVAAIVLFVLFPVCNLVVPANSALHISDYTVTLLGKIMCYAIVALAMDLIWGFTQHFWYCALLVVLVPGLLAFVFGYFAFRSRIKGVYFSIITQALTYAAMLFFFRNDTGFGGNNGFTDFKRILGYPVTAPTTRMALFAITGAALLGFLLLARAIVQSKLGRVLTAI